MMDTHLLPKDQEKVRFTDTNDFEHTGIFLADENMFYIGYEERGDFRFPFQIKHWESIDDTNTNDTYLRVTDITQLIVISHDQAYNTYKSFEKKGYSQEQLKAVRDLLNVFNLNYK